MSDDHAMSKDPSGTGILQSGPIGDTDEADYHVTRARAELDQAYRAEPRVAAEAHMRLSLLHMERARSATVRMRVTEVEQ